MLFNKPVTRQNKLTEMNRVDDDKGGGDRRGGKERKKERKKDRGKHGDIKWTGTENQWCHLVTLWMVKKGKKWIGLFN